MQSTTLLQSFYASAEAGGPDQFKVELIDIRDNYKIARFETGGITLFLVGANDEIEARIKRGDQVEVIGKDQTSEGMDAFMWDWDDKIPEMIELMSDRGEQILSEMTNCFAGVS